MKFWSYLAAALVVAVTAHAQNLQRVPTCGSATPGPGSSSGYMDNNGNACVTGTTKPSTYAALASTQTLTLTSSPQTLTVPTGATIATLTVQAGSAMYRDDGVTLTQTNGLTLQVGGPYTYSGPLAALNLILPSGVAGTTVTIGYYK